MGLLSTLSLPTQVEVELGYDKILIIGWDSLVNTAVRWLSQTSVFHLNFKEEENTIFARFL